MVLRQQLFTRSPLIISLIPPAMYGLEWKKRQDCRKPGTHLQIVHLFFACSDHHR